MKTIRPLQEAENWFLWIFFKPLRVGSKEEKSASAIDRYYTYCRKKQKGAKKMERKNLLLKKKTLEIEKACKFMKMKLLEKKMIEEGLEVPNLPTFYVESDSDSSVPSSDRKYFVYVFNI